MNGFEVQPKTKAELEPEVAEYTEKLKAAFAEFMLTGEKSYLAVFAAGAQFGFREGSDFVIKEIKPAGI